MPDWSIRIVLDKGKTWFLPYLQGGNGDPLNTQQDDLVSWNNTTEDTHQPWPTDQNYIPVDPSQVPRGSANYLSDPIPAGESSRPAYDTSQIGTVFYCCLIHKTEPTERGTIIVTAVPS